MSFDQSRSDKSEQHYRKTGGSASFNQQRHTSGAYGKVAGGVPAPSPSLSNRSFKKSNNDRSVRNVQNGAHVQPMLQGASGTSITSAAAKPVESATTQKSTRAAVPKTPTSQTATMSSDGTAPVKASGDASKAFSLQFGSISPGFMNGMQIPARTSSAPPDSLEQKCNQAHHDSSFRPVPDMHTAVPKQQQPRKDSVPTVQSNSGEAHPVPKVRKDAQAYVATPTNQTQKPSLLSLPMNPMQMPFHHQHQVPIQFGGPNAQIQSPTSIQMPMHMPLPFGNAPQVQQQVFVPGLQPHPLSSQGMIHHGQGLGFSPPIGSQLPPHLGSLGMGTAPQYPQQQGAKFGVPRKTTPVKITHPDTHEELRLDKRTDTYSDGAPSGPRPHPNVPSQSHPIPSFAPSHSTMFYPPPSSLPLSSSQIAPNAQGPRFNYPVSQGHQNISFMPAATSECMPVIASNEGRKESSNRSNSIKDYQKKTNKKGLIQPENQSMSASNLASHTAEHSISSGSSDVLSQHTRELPTDQQLDPVPALDLSEPTSKYEREGQVPSSKDKTVPELSRTKSNTARGKKKRKEILQKADAAGTTSDLYMAYKGPEENKETVASADNNSIGLNLKQTSPESSHVDGIESEKTAQDKAEPDDWEDAADISTSKLGSSDNGEKARGGAVNHKKGGSGNVAKKYSRDFVLKFAEKCTDLPHDFEIASDIVEAVMVANANASHFVDCDAYSNPGREIDRQYGGYRHDFRASGMVNDDRWIRQHGSFGPGRDLRFDLGYGADAGFRPGQGGNFGALRHPRGQAPMAYIGGVLGGPMQPMGPQGGMPYNSPDSSRWQRATNYQQRAPQTPLQMMHKAERKYEVGTVAGEEESKQRQLKAILNKLTPQNFEKLFEQVKAVNIDNAVTLTGVISQIFDKALMEPTFCEMYANFCYYLAGELPDFSQDNEKITFKRLLLNKCQEEFERGEKEQEEANKVEEEGESRQSEEEREEKRIKARRRMLGNIRLIGELYKKKMLTERIMHECIKKLLGEYEHPDEEDFEALCKLMSTIGDMIDHPKAKVHMDAYFERMAKLSNNMKLSSRVRFMLKDSIDLRKNKWQQRRKVEGPKKIDEVHRDAAQERQAQTSRLARGPGMNAATRRAPMDFGPRGSMLSSPGSQMGDFRGMPTQVRGFWGQDARMDDRHSFEARPLSVPLPQRPIGDDSITLGPQGGLARGMAYRGVPGISSAHIADASLAPAVPKDDSFDRAPAASAARGQRSSFTQDVPPERGLSEERLHDMSMSTIKEFYSARDEKEVALCIKDLNSPSFHPSMIALFVTDSFERKDVERDLLAKLLVNLTRSNDGVLSQVQLVQGFESVLSTLEDAVNDAPKAAEFLGRMFAKLVIEDVISLREVGSLIHDGGEEPGRLREVGLAGDVLGSILGVIRTEKGESLFNEIRSSSNLRLEDFRPHDPNKSRLLETFI